MMAIRESSPPPPWASLPPPPQVKVQPGQVTLTEECPAQHSPPVGCLPTEGKMGTFQDCEIFFLLKLGRKETKNPTYKEKITLQSKFS